MSPVKIPFLKPKMFNIHSFVAIGVDTHDVGGLQFRHMVVSEAVLDEVVWD